MTDNLLDVLTETEQILRDAAHEHAEGILECMYTENVNLDAAIKMGRTLLAQMHEAYPLPQEMQIAVGVSYEMAVGIVYDMRDAARKLIRQDEEGSPLPKTYTWGPELRERYLAMMDAGFDEEPH